MKNKIKNNQSQSLGDSFLVSVFNNNQAIMLLVDPDKNQKILDVNESALKFYGYTREQILKLDMGSINTKALTERNKLMEKAVKLPHSYYQFEHKTSSGLIKTVEVNASPVDYNNKKIMFIIVHDVTELKTIKVALKESEERFGLALAGTELGLWDLWVQTDEFHVNERWAEIFGYTLEELFPISNNTWRENSHPEDVKKADRLFKKYLRKEIDSYACEIRMRHKDGSWVWIYTMGKISIWSEDGKPIRMSGTHLDITERKKTELKLYKSEERFRSYFESSPLSLWEEDYSDIISYIQKSPATDCKCFSDYLDENPKEVEKCFEMLKIVDVNSTTLILYQAENKEELVQNISNIFTTESRNLFKNKLISFYNKKLYFSDETIHRTLKGQVINIKLDSVLLSDFRVLITITDITELKSKEAENKELLVQAKADSETKEILLREINHRVKNNLSSFIGMLYAEKKQSGNDPDTAKMEHVDSLINRIKGISIAHEMLSKSQWASISLFSLTEKIIHSLKHLVPKDRVFETKISPSNIVLDADQSHSFAIIINEIILNAIEHAAGSGQKVVVKIDIKCGRGKIKFKYKDNGPGFPEEVLNYEFHNVGMYLIKNIVEQSLRGVMKISNDGGAEIEIEFPGGSKLEEL